MNWREILAIGLSVSLFVGILGYFAVKNNQVDCEEQKHLTIKV